MRQLPDLAKDGILTKSFWGQVRTIINANFREVMIQPGIGYNAKIGAGGTSLEIKTGGGVGASAPVIKPLQIMLSSSGDTYYLSLYPGTVDGIYPKVDDKFLWQMPSDGSGGFLDYPQQEITLPATGAIQNVWLTCTSVAGRITEAVCDTGATVPADTAGTAHVQLGYIRHDGSIYQQTFGPLAYQLVFGIYDNTWSHSFTYAT